MNVHWNEVHCGLVVVKLQKCEFYSKNIEKVKKPKDIGTFWKRCAGSNRDPRACHRSRGGDTAVQS